MIRRVRFLFSCATLMLGILTVSGTAYADNAPSQTPTATPLTSPLTCANATKVGIQFCFQITGTGDYVKTFSGTVYNYESYAQSCNIYVGGPADLWGPKLATVQSFTTINWGITVNKTVVAGEYYAECTGIGFTAVVYQDVHP